MPSEATLIQLIAVVCVAAGAVWGFATWIMSRETRIKQELAAMIKTALAPLQHDLERFEEQETAAVAKLVKQLDTKASKEDLIAIGRAVDGFRSQMWQLLSDLVNKANH